MSCSEECQKYVGLFEKVAGDYMSRCCWPSGVEITINNLQRLFGKKMNGTLERQTTLCC